MRMKTRRMFLKQSTAIACGILAAPSVLSVVTNRNNESFVPKGKTVNICDFGAKGDGKFVNTKIFNDAVVSCSEQGGGTVIIPAGVFLTGTIRLKSGVSLFLEKGAVIKGVTDLKEYYPYIPSNEKGNAGNDGKHNWNRALLLGDGVSDVTISGKGIIDGSHVVDPQGEENMRGPHAILFGESRNITLSGISILQAANYAFMAYNIENTKFRNLVIKEGWDGIHIRGGKNITIRDSEFYTGDDAIAGGYWENMVITKCHINSSCNGIRMIMPATDLTISDCTFRGPGEYPHRTSKERKRRNMLSAILLQPGGWGNAPGRVDKVVIRDLVMENLDNPFMFILNQGNECGSICVERVKAKHIMQSASSVESWNGGSFETVSFRDVSIEYDGHEDANLRNIQISKPHVDARMLPCWAWFVKNVKSLAFENVKLFYTGLETRPAFIFENVGTVKLKNVKCRQVKGVEPIVVKNTAKTEGTGISQFK